MEVNGIELVECPPYRMQLTPGRCASNWESVAGKHRHKLERLEHCLDCPLGAQRAGKQAVPTPLPRFCCRCLKLSPRLIGAKLCPSCYNRQRELELGRNARGTAPVKITPVFSVTAKVGDVEVVMTAADRIEVAMVTLRQDSTATIGWAHAVKAPAQFQTLWGGV